MTWVVDVGFFFIQFENRESVSHESWKKLTIPDAINFPLKEIYLLKKLNHNSKKIKLKTDFNCLKKRPEYHFIFIVNVIGREL